MAMDSRERTFRALEHKTGDRIPVDFWASRSMIQKLERSLGMTYEQFLDRYDVDLRYIAGPEYIGPTLEDCKDIWGVKRITVNVNLKLADAESVDEIENYPHWPSSDWFDFSAIEAQCNEVRAKGRAVVFMGDRLNRVAQLKPAMYLRGIENIFMDLAMGEEIAHAIFRKIRKFYLVYLERILKAAKGKIDIVLTGDDFGSQNGLLISADMWRNFIKPGFAEYISLIKNHGARAMHHTCGSVVEIIPELIKCGLDVLQSIQPEAVNMSLAELKTKFGQMLCFHGGISIQKTMPFGSADEVRQEVKKIADIIKPDDGYIFCTSHNIQSDTCIENVQALMEAYRGYGRY
jgi:uroporphyrinogen decarboxylase